MYTAGYNTIMKKCRDDLVNVPDGTYVTAPCVVENYDGDDADASGSGSGDEIYEGAGFEGNAPSNCTNEQEGKSQYSYISQRDDGTAGTCVPGSTYTTGKDVHLSQCDSRLLDFETCDHDELETGSGGGSGCGFKYVSSPCVYLSKIRVTCLKMQPLSTSRSTIGGT